MDNADLLQLLKLDLQRHGDIPGDDLYLPHLLQAAKSGLERQGVRDDNSQDYAYTVIATAAWMYRKRITGEPEPKSLRMLRLNLLVSQAAADGDGGDGDNDP